MSKLFDRLCKIDLKIGVRSYNPTNKFIFILDGNKLTKAIIMINYAQIRFQKKRYTIILNIIKKLQPKLDYLRI